MASALRWFVLFVLVALPLARAATPPAASAPPALPSPLARLLATPPLAKAHIGIVAIDLTTGELRVAHGADRSLMPASTMKVVTTACALDVLGPAWTTRTEILADGEPDASGRLAGPLYVRGGGDPLLRPEDLWSTLRQVAALGLVRVDGGIVIDDTLFAPETRPASWPKQRVGDPYDAAQSAFAFAWNAIEVVVRPGAAPGEPAIVTAHPLSDAVALVNEAKTGTRSSLVVRHEENGATPATITVRGTIAAGGPPSREWVHMGDPVAAGLPAVRELAERAGIAVEGPLTRGRVTEHAVLLAARPSEPLRELVAVVNKTSSNFGAEILLRWLDPALPLSPGSTAGGADAVRACFEAWGTPQDGTAIYDGSGYSRENRLTARALASILEHAWREASWGPELLVSLPRAHEDGSLRRRLRGLEGRVRAKTGTLRDVASLAGYAWTATGTPYAFAIIANGKDGAGASRAWTDDVLVALLRGLDDEERTRRAKDPSPKS